MLSLQELNDERDIKLVYCAYCDIIDAKDFDRLTEVFTTDAVQDYRSTLGPDAIMHGTEPLIAGAHIHMGEGSNCGATHHNVVNFPHSCQRRYRQGQGALLRGASEGVGKYPGAVYSMWGEYDDDLDPHPGRLAGQESPLSLLHDRRDRM